MKDHQIAQLINQLCSIAEEFAGTQQLRERLAVPVRAAFRRQDTATTGGGSSVVRVCPECDIADCKHIRSNSEGCSCQSCRKVFTADLLVPDDVWEVIKPEGKPIGSGILCPTCVTTRCVEMKMATHLLAELHF